MPRGSFIQLDLRWLTPAPHRSTFHLIAAFFLIPFIIKVTAVYFGIIFEAWKTLPERWTNYITRVTLCHTEWPAPLAPAG